MEDSHPEVRRTPTTATWSVRTPMLLAAIAIVLVTGFNTWRLIRRPAPRNPMEAVEVVEAWRSMSGMPLYEAPPAGHTTHFYGALGPWIQGEIFRWVGPNNISGRVLTLISALATITLIAAATRTSGSPLFLFVAWAALLGVNHRALQYFSENRPDMTAMYFVTAALILIGLGQERRRLRPVVLGSVALVVGFYFKQTAHIFAVVPLVVMASRLRRPSPREVLLAAIPLVICGASTLALKVISPTVYHYMVEIPKAYTIDYYAAVKYVYEFLAASPLFLVLLGDWLLLDGGTPARDRRIRWVVATLIVSIPFGAISYAKYRGAGNSMLPALLGMVAFCALRLPDVVRRLEKSSAVPIARRACGAILALLLFATTFPGGGWFARPDGWDGAYGEVVSAASRLPGKVICPEDPTIIVYAKQQAGRSIFAEFDGHPVAGAWSESIPESMLAELREADYVVDLKDYWDDCINERVLRGLGFVPSEASWPDPSRYGLWHRGTAATAARAARAAWNPPDDPSRPRTSVE